MFKELFDRFSRRLDSKAKGEHEVPQQTRMRVVMWCNEVFDGYERTFWEEIERIWRYRHTDRIELMQRHGVPAVVVGECTGAEFLDFIEDVFRVDVLFHARKARDRMVNDLNELFRVDGLPYHLTDYLEQTVTRRIEPLAGMGLENHQVREVVALPKVVMRESDVVHTMAVEPALQLLRRPHFKNASDEYLAALEDYRKGDFGDSLTKCGASFESALKVLCDRKGWPYNSTDTAAPLIHTVVSRAGLDGYYEQPLVLVATLRNRQSTAHGAGTGTRAVPQHVALYALNATASAILLLASASGES